MSIIRTISVSLAVLVGCHPDEALADSRKALSLEVNPEKFNASRADIAAVCRSAGYQLLVNMTEVPDFTVNISRGQHGPIALFQRGANGEYLVQLATEKTFWAQYAYQFSHEICHILCGYENDYRGNLWFEETLCETASLYCLKAMSHEWRTRPPYGNWRSYSPALSDYADNIRKEEMTTCRSCELAYLHTIESTRIIWQETPRTEKKMEPWLWSFCHFSNEILIIGTPFAG